MELAGEVELVGKNVKRFKEGTKFLQHPWLDLVLMPNISVCAEDGPVAIKPSNITYGEAAAIPIGARTALYFLRKAGIGAVNRF